MLVPEAHLSSVPPSSMATSWGKMGRKQNVNAETCFIVSVAGEIPRIHPVIYTGLCVKVVDLAHTGVTFRLYDVLKCDDR